MGRLTHTELAEAHGRAQWAVLWEHAIPLVKMTVGRMARGNKAAAPDAFEEMLQEGYLIAGSALRSWDPIECAYSTHITNTVRWQLISHLGETRNHGIGSHAQKPAVLNLCDSRDGMFGFGSDEHTEEDEDDGTFDAALTYEGVLRPSGQYDGYGSAPRDLGNPADEADLQRQEEAIRQAVESLPQDQRLLVQALMGFDEAPMTVRQYAKWAGIPSSTIGNRLLRAIDVLRQKLPNFHHNKYGSKEDVRDTQ